MLLKNKDTRNLLFEHLDILFGQVNNVFGHVNIHYLSKGQVLTNNIVDELRCSKKGMQLLFY